MNFNLVEMYNGLLRFNKHILNELAEGLKHLPNLDGVSKGDSLIITVNELKTKVETYSDKINELEQRVHQLENASQS